VWHPGNGPWDETALGLSKMNWNNDSLYDPLPVTRGYAKVFARLVKRMFGLGSGIALSGSKSVQPQGSLVVLWNTLSFVVHHPQIGLGRAPNQLVLHVGRSYSGFRSMQETGR